MTCSCAVNEVLIALMVERVKLEVARMMKAGATTGQINDALAEHILPYYEEWRRETLERAMAEVESMSLPPDDLAPLTPMRRN